MSSEKKKHGGRIDNWYQAGKLIYGNLYDDPSKRFADGAGIHTSTIVDLNEGDEKLETLNTIYDLGSKFNSDK